MEKKTRLREIILEKSLKRGDFILASGARSHYLFDLKPTLLDPEGANLTADLMITAMAGQVDAVGGLELGACPIVSAVCVKSYLAGTPLKSFYVRKAQKERGSKKRIEGGELQKGDRVMMVEDVTTTGGSVMEAIRVAEGEGAIVAGVFSVVDRLEGARENLEKEGLALYSLFTRSDFF